MRADRLVSLVLLLRQRGRLSASTLAAELEVSTRTVLRDIEALSIAGVPVYADRGRHGGFTLLPGFRTELTGLNHDEALALLTAGGAGAKDTFGLSTALSSAMRKIVDALPPGHQLTAADAAQRILVDPDADLLSRRRIAEVIPDAIMGEVRRAVLDGRRLRIRYGAPDREPVWRVIDPIGLVTVRDQGYLLAAVEGTERTYRLSRILAAEGLAEAAERAAEVDLVELWQQRSARFRAGEDQLEVVILLETPRREEVASTAVTVIEESVAETGQLRMTVTFQDLRHAEWALWQLGSGAEALTPPELRARLRDRAVAVAARYADPPRTEPDHGRSGKPIPTSSEEHL